MDMANAALPATWHDKPADDIIAALDSSASGLSQEEAALRLEVQGPNSLPTAKARGPLRRLLAQFHNVLIYVLLGSAAVSALLGHGVDAAVILAVVIANAAIGFVQEGRAEDALQAISRMINPTASVLRAGRRLTVPAEDIVTGDIVLLEAGDRVPADLRLMRSRNLRIDEAALTGESVPVEKKTDAVPADAVLGDRLSMAYSGTFVAAGQGTGVVTATGAGTELGRISTLIGKVEALQTPLIRQMDGFARQLTVITLALCAATFLFAYAVRDYPVAEAFMIVVGLAVAAIPEGLPAIMTITLAIGVKKMADRRAIIRRLPAVETLGSVSVICSDKTGTLTRNEMTVRSLVTAASECEVTGVGYEPEGSFLLLELEISPREFPLLVELMRAGVLCNDADIRQTAEGWRPDGDPMEAALVSVARKAGIDTEAMRRDTRRIDEIPFDAQHRYMAALHEDDAEGRLIFIKGAPERILQMCAHEWHKDGRRPIDVPAWEKLADELASRGQRVLGFAMKAAADLRHLGPADVEDDAVLLGFAGFIDPPRAEAVEAIADCARAGIRVVMITGDHAVTAGEIGRQLGLAEQPRVLTGRDVDALTDEELRETVKSVQVFARTTPENKLRLVEALQSHGLIVAMTGDGVNDAPALKRADVGVAMGRKGTEAAKEASEMVLADDNFASIVAAVREGRTVYDNITKVIAWTLPTNGGEALTILCAIALGLALPITAVQILWINMVTAVALGLTLAFEPTEPGTMSRAPRRRDQPILTGYLLWRVALVSFLFVVGAFGVFYWATTNGLAQEAARTMVVNTLVVMEIFYLFSIRYVHGASLTWQGVMGTRAVLIGVAAVTAAQFAFTYAPFMNRTFGSEPLSLAEGLIVIGVGVLLLMIIETEKRFAGPVQAAISGRLVNAGRSREAAR
ncbi:MAG: cation-transporting P-type ATPase [Rhodomicrobiaceae bacterium]